MSYPIQHSAVHSTVHGTWYSAALYVAQAPFSSLGTWRKNILGSYKAACRLHRMLPNQVGAAGITPFWTSVRLYSELDFFKHSLNMLPYPLSSLLKY